MIKRFAVGLAVVAFAMALGGTASAATARPAPSDWSVTTGCEMTHDCELMTPNAWDW
jgi:hypothetical protein